MSDDVEDRRAHVLETAARLLVEEGAGALSLRRICAAAGGSTQLAYTLFGGKSGLLDALYAEAFDRLEKSMQEAGFEEVDAADPERLIRISRGYRRWATTEPGFFSVIFGRAIPGFRPKPAARAAGRAKTFGRVIESAKACMDAGVLQASDPLTLASACWATTHGLSSLETNGIIGGDHALIARYDADAFAEHLISLMLDAHRPVPAARRRSSPRLR